MIREPAHDTLGRMPTQRKLDHDRLGHLLSDRQHDMLVADQTTAEKPPA